MCLTHVVQPKQTASLRFIVTSSVFLPRCIISTRLRCPPDRSMACCGRHPVLKTFLSRSRKSPRSRWNRVKYSSMSFVSLHVWAACARWIGLCIGEVISKTYTLHDTKHSTCVHILSTTSIFYTFKLHATPKIFFLLLPLRVPCHYFTYFWVWNMSNRTRHALL